MVWLEFPLSDLVRYGLYLVLILAFGIALLPRRATSAAPRTIIQVRIAGSVVQATFDTGLVMTLAQSGSTTTPAAGPLATWCDQAYIWPFGFAGTAYFVDANGVEHIGFRSSSK